jgi:hypothetical protein
VGNGDDVVFRGVISILSCVWAIADNLASQCYATQIYHLIEDCPLLGVRQVRSLRFAIGKLEGFPA